MNTIIFDNDGTLIDTERLYFQSWLEMAKKYNFHFDLEVKKLMNGKNFDETTTAISELFGFDLPTAHKINTEMNEMRIDSINNRKGTLYKPYTLELLEYLKNEGYKLAIATASHEDRIDFIYKNEKVDIRKYFDAIITGDQITKGKPNPQIFNMAIEKLNSKPEDTYIIEDSSSGIKAANLAKATSVLIIDLDDSKQTQNDADLVFNNFKEFKEYLEKKKN